MEDIEMFKDKTFLIIGGTYFFGDAVIKKIASGISDYTLGSDSEKHIYWII